MSNASSALWSELQLTKLYVCGGHVSVLYDWLLSRFYAICFVPVHAIVGKHTCQELREVGIRHFYCSIIVIIDRNCLCLYLSLKADTHPTCPPTQAKKMCKSKHMGHYCQGTYCHSWTTLELSQSCPYGIQLIVEHRGGPEGGNLARNTTIHLLIEF
jgi:hypothetical protein